MIEPDPIEDDDADELIEALERARSPEQAREIVRTWFEAFVASCRRPDA
jgi:hypothetical protein